MTKPKKIRLYLLFPLLLLSRAPGTKDMCLVTLIAMVGSVGLWALVATRTVMWLV